MSDKPRIYRIWAARLGIFLWTVNDVKHWRGITTQENRDLWRKAHVHCSKLNDQERKV